MLLYNQAAYSVQSGLKATLSTKSQRVAFCHLRVSYTRKSVSVSRFSPETMPLVHTKICVGHSHKLRFACCISIIRSSVNTAQLLFLKPSTRNQSPYRLNYPHFTRKIEKKIRSYHGSNSWMMLSKRITANRRELKPTSHARVKIAKDNRLFNPLGFHIVVRRSVFIPASAIFFPKPRLDR